MNPVETLSSEEVKALLDAMDELVELKTFIRKIVPKYAMDEEGRNFFISHLKALRGNLLPLFSRFLGTTKEEEKEQDLTKKIQELTESTNVVLVSSNSAKKTLKGMGFDARLILVTGGPLVAEDYRIVNPKIPESAMKGINKKCQRILEEIKDINWEEKDLIFIKEKNNPADDLIEKRLSIIEEMIDKKISTMIIESWDIMER